MKYILILFLALSATVANGQLVTTVGQNQDLFQKNLYSADRVMELRNELDLSEAQATKIKKIHSENAGKFSTMKWDLDDETKKLKALLDQSKIDEVAVQKQMDKVLALENSLKKQQLSTMVSIKNELNTEQQEILQAQRVQTVNGVNISGYGVKSLSPTGTVTGYPNVRVAKGGSFPNTKVAVQVVGTGQENAPLYMIESTDGIKQVEGLQDINPDDIESINVLKDDSAVKKYGEKGKNGVIIVKLKGAKK
ncbi:TonB-dependent receptor plug domain-containing protein [Algoriphagus sp. AGSA1]|uniref:Spy/CpxP family protein refolding chaperone n=1 Tax=Algoriphagus sp. AGSA1 TaxID=2907213 RepID=UPI001F187039|nr:periplasmic heavy metal sensor [Algoriphagus sp. AGSA1]MCE7055071.1 TonB-dependent receptor plug domain-containing protein [Algoriphagus sp. AGSA1]